MRINDYPEKTTIDETDKLVVDTEVGTRSMLVNTVIENILDEIRTSGLLYFEMLNNLSLEERLNHYGGRELGVDSVSDAHKQSILDGSFYDIYIGDYWVLNGVKYYVADVNYWMSNAALNDANNPEISNKARYTPHLLLIPESPISNMQMHDAGSLNTNGYSDCKWRTSQAKTDLKNLMITYFGENMLLDHLESLPVSLSYEDIIGTDTGSNISRIIETAICDFSNFDIPSQEMIIGHRIDGYTSETNALTQLRLFKYNPSLILCGNFGDSYWLRNLSDNNHGFLRVDNSQQGINILGSSGERVISGIRPIIVIGYNPNNTEEGDQSEL